MNRSYGAIRRPFEPVPRESASSPTMLFCRTEKIGWKWVAIASVASRRPSDTGCGSAGSGPDLFTTRWSCMCASEAHRHAIARPERIANELTITKHCRGRPIGQPCGSTVRWTGAALSSNLATSWRWTVAAAVHDAHPLTVVSRRRARCLVRRRGARRRARGRGPDSGVGRGRDPRGARSDDPHRAHATADPRAVASRAGPTPGPRSPARSPKPRSFSPIHASATRGRFRSAAR